MPLPGLTRDTVVISRPGSASDAEGNPTDVLTVIQTTRGTWGSPRQSDVLQATQRGQQLDAIVAGAGFDVQLGDRMNVRSKDYEVIGITSARFHDRVGLRLVE